MVIKTSSRQQVDALIAQLGADDLVTRDTAITRLTIIGARAVERVMTLAGDRSAPPSARAAALKVLEGVADPRSLDLILRQTADSRLAVAAAAASAARAFLRDLRGAEAVDCLTALALDTKRAVPVRLAALGALADLGTPAVQPIYSALAKDSNAEIAALAARPSPTSSEEATDLLLKAATEGELPDDPAGLSRALGEVASTLPLPVLQKLIERVSAREATVSLKRRSLWVGLRGLAHAALAGRGSRLALYDLRETVERATAPLPAEFLSALRQIGDGSCLEPIAAGMARSSDAASRAQLVDVFRHVAAREHVSRRHAVAKRIERRWPSVAADVWSRPSTPSRTRHR